MHVLMATVSHTTEIYQWRSQVTHVSPGLPSVLIGTRELQTTSLNWTTPATHAGTLVVRPLSVLGATQQMLQCDGNIATSQIVIQVRFVSIGINPTSLVFQRVCLHQPGGRGWLFCFRVSVRDRLITASVTSHSNKSKLRSACPDLASGLHGIQRKRG